MLLRIIDYIGNPGGGIRFVVELVAALAELPDAPRIEFVSDGEAFCRYESAFRTRCPTVAMRRIRPCNNPRLVNRWYHSLPGMTLIPSLLRGGDRDSLFHIHLGHDSIRGADVVWFPWIHGHRLTGGHQHVVATYHDTIAVDFPGILPPDGRRRALTLESEWCHSRAVVTVTSHATARSLERLYGVARTTFPVVHLSAIHHTPARSASPPAAEGAWQAGPYLLCPANTSIHKNHDVLLSGYAEWGAKLPLVLTGTGTDFLRGPRTTQRARHLNDLATRLHLDETRIIGLGYISDERYFSLLQRCHAVVMPTLAEGGGSFPVAEAVQAGIPVVCSDIPVMREAMEIFGGSPLWFDPHRSHALATALRTLEQNYGDLRRAAASCNTASSRRWRDVAEDYLTLFRRAPSADNEAFTRAPSRRAE